MSYDIASLLSDSWLKDNVRTAGEHCNSQKEINGKRSHIAASAGGRNEMK